MLITKQNVYTLETGTLEHVAEACLDAVARPLEVTVGTWNAAPALFDLVARELVLRERVKRVSPGILDEGSPVSPVNGPLY